MDGSNPVLFAEAHVYVNITDRNEPPHFLRSHYYGTIAEWAHSGAVVVDDLEAVDDDIVRRCLCGRVGERERGRGDWKGRERGEGVGEGERLGGEGKGERERERGTGREGRGKKREGEERERDVKRGGRERNRRRGRGEGV